MFRMFLIYSVLFLGQSRKLNRLVLPLQHQKEPLMTRIFPAIVLATPAGHAFLVKLLLLTYPVVAK
ncbi:hypothetical protein DS901_10560 [Loktanella sp. D2R18]|nr:hypothetical protein DS901_10560 [Loktanella sp. D2R18]